MTYEECINDVAGEVYKYRTDASKNIRGFVLGGSMDEDRFIAICFLKEYCWMNEFIVGKDNLSENMRTVCMHTLYIYLDNKYMDREANKKSLEEFWRQQWQ